MSFGRDLYNIASAQHPRLAYAQNAHYCPMCGLVHEDFNGTECKRCGLKFSSLQPFNPCNPFHLAGMCKFLNIQHDIAYYDMDDPCGYIETLGVMLIEADTNENLHNALIANNNARIVMVSKNYALIIVE